jgi:hypothetical protein
MPVNEVLQRNRWDRGGIDIDQTPIAKASSEPVPELPGALVHRVSWRASADWFHQITRFRVN